MSMHRRIARLEVTNQATTRGGPAGRYVCPRCGVWDWARLVREAAGGTRPLACDCGGGGLLAALAATLPHGECP